MKQKVISEHMRRTLAAVVAGGGRAIPQGGGYWRGANGRRLSYPPVPGSTRAFLGEPEPVGTTTLRALAQRGLLEEDPADAGLAAHRRAFRVVNRGVTT